MPEQAIASSTSWNRKFKSGSNRLCFVFIRWIHLLFWAFLILLQRFCQEMHAMEQIFIKVNSIYSFVCQLLFFTMCELALLEQSKEPRTEKKSVTGLTTLLFYSIFGYFVGKIRDICVKGWSRSARLTYSSRDYIKWIFKILVEWAKAVIVVLCLKEQGMTYHPEVFYSIVTFSYYLCTEKLFAETFQKIIRYFNFECLESMEHLYAPVVLYVYTIIAAVLVGTYALYTEFAKYALFASYFLLYIRFKDVYYNYVKVILLERKTYASFRVANERDIQEWDDICAVCLNRMSRARITPCNHLFHPACLKRCLQNSFQCPLCKYDFIVE